MDGTIAVSWLDVPLPYVRWFENVAICINNDTHLLSPRVERVVSQCGPMEGRIRKKRGNPGGPGFPLSAIAHQARS